MKFLVVGTLDADSLPPRTHTHTTSYFSRSLHIPAFTCQCWVPGSTPWMIHWQRCTVFLELELTNLLRKRNTCALADFRIPMIFGTRGKQFIVTLISTRTF